MLLNLTVKNLAIAADVTISFGAGLNIITGETGAGKSILMGALELVLGARADRNAIREGATEASIEACFALTQVDEIQTLLQEMALPACEEGTLIVRRQIQLNGTGRCFINDTATTLQTLRRLGLLLVDIHGPYDHQSLLNADFQREILDAYGDCQLARTHYTTTWQAYKELEERLQDLQADSQDIEAECENLQYMVDEITQANLSEEDAEGLVARHAEAANSEQILHLGATINTMLFEDQPCAFELLRIVQQQLEVLAPLLPEAHAWRQEARSIAVQLQELGRSMTDRLTQIEVQPDTLQQLEERMALVQRLKRKYGSSIAAILERQAALEERLHDLLTRSDQVAALQQAIAAKHTELIDHGEQLRALRQQAAQHLAQAITQELHDLGFLQSGFAVELTPTAAGPRGLDLITFGFAPNPGEPLRPLRAIASSGEISRIMLAVKAVLSTHDSIPILVFDEIDANIGGEVGSVVGQKLRRVAQDHQVISITHLPQSAVYGQQHYKVQKEVIQGRTRMRVAPLDEAGRINEIVRMLGGHGSSEVVVTHARELLLAAQAAH